MGPHLPARCPHIHSFIGSSIPQTGMKRPPRAKQEGQRSEHRVMCGVTGLTPQEGGDNKQVGDGMFS